MHLNKYVCAFISFTRFIPNPSVIRLPFVWDKYFNKKYKICGDYTNYFLLSIAIKWRDPYRIVESYKKIDKEKFKFEATYINAVLESARWLKVESIETDYQDKINNDCCVKLDFLLNIYKNGLCVDDMDKINSLHSELIWPLFLIKGSFYEVNCRPDLALDNYKHALSSMPTWIGEYNYN